MTADTAKLTVKQAEHATRLETIHRSFPFAMDLSQAGFGKTLVALELARRGKYTNVLVVAPTSVEIKWRRFLGISERPDARGWLAGGRHTRAAVVTFRMLRGATRNSYLNRSEFAGTAKSRCSFKFSATSDLVAKLNDGTLVIIDEAHSARNISQTMEAVRAVCAAAAAAAASRVLAMTATIYDRRENAQIFAYTLGIASSPEAAERGSDRAQTHVRLTGAADVVSFIREKVDRRSAAGPPTDYGQFSVFSRDDATNFVFTAMAERVIPATSSKMDAECTFGVKVDCANVFVNQSLTPPEWHGAALGDGKTAVDDAAEKVRSIVSDLYEGDARNPTKAAINGVSLSRIRCAMQASELAKAPTVARLVIQALNDEGGCKIIVALNYLAAASVVADRLRAEMPGVGIAEMSGGTPKTVRDNFVTTFQRDTDEIRVLVCMTPVIAVGIDLDDRFGTRPRTIIALPSFFSINLHQLTYRVFRSHTTRSDATVRFVYSEGMREDLVMRAARLKAANLRESSGTPLDDGIVYADAYRTLIEACDGSVYEVPTSDGPHAKDDVRRREAFSGRRFAGIRARLAEMQATATVGAFDIFDI
jgi:superfamily II DNA or RNA helicase